LEVFVASEEALKVANMCPLNNPLVGFEKLENLFSKIACSE
jgi:hypothetical protein